MGVNVVLLGKKFNVKYLKALYWACCSYYTSVIYKEILSDLAKPVLFADDTNILIFVKNPMNFKIKTNKLFVKIHEWFEKIC
jgi:hypothetical protein